MRLALVLLLSLSWAGCGLLLDVDPHVDGAATGPLDGAVADATWTDAAVADASAGGDWTPLYDLDPARDGCPAGFRLTDTVPSIDGTTVPLVACTTEDGDTSPERYRAIFDTGGPWQELRGYIHGYMIQTPDAFNTSGTTLDEAYVDGISLTVGSPRRHLFTFAAALTAFSGDAACPCRGGTPPPPFVGDAYACESGNDDDEFVNRYLWYPSELLWDEGADATVCDAYPGTFAVRLDAPTTDPVELRFLRDTVDEHIAIASMRLEIR